MAERLRRINCLLKILLLGVIHLYCLSGLAQVIENPVFDKSDIPSFYIKRVEITKDTTYVFCSFYAEEGSLASISKDTYLRDTKSYKIFPLLRCEGLPYTPEKRGFSKNECCELLFCFPSIAGAEKFDFIENENERDFNVYGISLKKQFKTSYIDSELKRISEMVSTYNSSRDAEKEMLLKDYATSLNNLVSYYVSTGNHTEAIRLGTIEMKIRERVFGKEHPSYIESINNLAKYYSDSGNYAEAIQLQAEATLLLKNTFGSDNISYIRSLVNLMHYNSRFGNYIEAIKLGTEAKEIIIKTIGTENLNYAIFLSHIALYYYSIGNYAVALRLQTETTAVLMKTIGSENANYAKALDMLALYNSKLGNYSKAVEIATEAKEIFKRFLGELHPDYCTSLGNLASYYAMCGNYVEAIRLGTESTEISKRLLGIEHPNYAIYLNNLASYIWLCGSYTESIRLNTEVMEILKKVFGDKHPNYATSLSNLATCYSDCKNYAEAIRLNTEAMEIRKNALGTEHPDYAQSLDNLAIDNSNCGYYASAKYYAKEAMEIRKKVLGNDHPDYATSLSNLAVIYSDLGNNSEAIRLATEAMEIRKSVLGPEHPDYALSLGILADSYFDIGNYDKSYCYLKQKIKRTRDYLLKNLVVLPSNYQNTLWLTKFAHVFFKTFPLSVSKIRSRESISELYNNTCLFAKGMLLNTSIEIRKQILESRDSLLIDKYNTLSTNINIYNKLVEKPIKERFLNTDSLNRVIQKQEIELARESKVYGDFTRNLTITWKDVQQKLKKGDIAIEFLDYNLAETCNKMYVALTLKKEYDCPHMVRLFERNQLNVIHEDAYYTQSDVYDLIWKPLEEELKGVRNIYFAPSGELHKIGIEYLPISKTENICDVYSLHRLSSTRQLAVIQDEAKGKNSILYGGINYDEKSSTITTDATSASDTLLRSAITYRANVDSLSLRNSYDYLEGSKREVDLIAEDMERHRVPYNYYSGTDATEESFKHLDGTRPKMMHIATHGFYLTEEKAMKSQFARPKMELLTDGGLQGRIVEQKPMSRSGLLFSGCNRIVRHEDIPEEEEDGILTAQEISMLDLRGLDLVVLSACQTGLGDIISGEGVFGLQRGFKKAGAKTIIMSLWNVNDESTMKMMTSFYHHYLEGMSKEKAFRAAQDELRKDIPTQQGRPDWAAFIMLDGLNK